MSKTHGLSNTPEYKIWKNIKSRCYNKNRNGYHRYGGRGIVMSDEWKTNYLIFLEDIGPRPSPKHSIERRDNNGNYCKENCYWATQIEQMNNTCNTIFLEFNGERLCLLQWSIKTGILPQTLYNRYFSGWDIKRILTEPCKKWTRKEKCTYLEFNGKRLSLTDWANETGISFNAIRNRISRGWTVEKTLTTPMRKW